MDVKTLYFILLCVLVIQSIALFLTWRVNTIETGIRDWSSAAILLASGILVAITGSGVSFPGNDSLQGITRVLIICLGNTLSVSGYFLIWVGARKFFHKSAPGYGKIILLCIPFYLVSLLELVMPVPSTWRVYWGSGIILLLLGMVIIEFAKSHESRDPVVRLIISAVFMLLIAGLLRVASIYLDNEYVVMEPRMASVIYGYAAIMVSVTLTPSIILLTNERINQQLKTLALRDPLTGALNRRAFFEYSLPVMADLDRSPVYISVCIVDLDHFKKINDEHGHVVGDAVLVWFAGRAMKIICETDLFARYGGEEFVFLLKGSNKEQAYKMIERLRKSCAGQELVPGLKNIEFSAGISQVHGPVHHIEIETLLSNADRALYEAKRNGRNQTRYMWYLFES